MSTQNIARCHETLKPLVQVTTFEDTERKIAFLRECGYTEFHTTVVFPEEESNE